MYRYTYHPTADAASPKQEVTEARVSALAWQLWEALEVADTLRRQRDTAQEELAIAKVRIAELECTP